MHTLPKLDDIQELFDKRNRENIARSISAIVNDGNRIIINTNDHDFSKTITRSFGRNAVFEIIDYLQIHPLISERPHIVLGEFPEAIDEKRREFKKSDNDQVARDYIKDFRIYLEQNIFDYFDEFPLRCQHMPMLSDFINALRKRLSSGVRGICSDAFKNLVNDQALQDGSNFLDLMNKVHHRKENEIYYKDVEDVEHDCDRVHKLVDIAHEDYDRWMRGKGSDDKAEKPEMPSSVECLRFEAPLIRDLAAFTSETAPSEVPEVEEKYNIDWLENYAIYMINTEDFGFSGFRGCKAIVKLSEESIHDNSLVIALHEDTIYARRLLKYINDPTIIALGSEVEDPTKRSPSILLPAEEVRLLEVAGILFDYSPHWPKPKGEAYYLEDYRFSEKIEIVFSIRDDSAVPLALSGQKALGGSKLLPDQIGNNEGCIVALVTSNGEALKRIGKSVEEVPRLRLFESIGGKGKSILVRTEEIEDDPFSMLTLLEPHSTRKVLGFLYDNK